MSHPEDLEEIKRLETLLSYNILDTPYEKDFNDLVRLMSIICETPIAIISMMDERKTETTKETTVIRETEQEFVLERTAKKVDTEVNKEIDEEIEKIGDDN